ncbi:class I SAM-dependent methyltransferase [Streptomyces oceani]|uniref:Ubiquinone biosynthesis methyltransferase UbiE n=1 Tax=Streptomyces oceani TaxID=1075402 RepID=A0A1E7JXR1_9ACTN|nr:class I SAM-dependent methyltransferase [Streptomyces oceani]OEU96479.1 ubiquinone biosynthesis methyltransferase UbiE [Streptomyces oceani]
MRLLHDHELSAAFDHAAGAYDRFTAVNPGYHTALRRSARRLRLPQEGSGSRVLDLGCGTGSSTAALLRAAPRARVVGVDSSWGMLRRATAKRWPAGAVEFVHGRVEDLTETVGTGPFDAVFAAYLFRNLTDPDAVLRQARSVLRPGGRLVVHEYALSGAPAHRALWTALCRGGLVPIASLRGDGRLYRHLSHSVLEFDTARAFRGRLRAVGFEQVRVLPVTGWQWGIVHTFTARDGGLR